MRARVLVPLLPFVALFWSACGYQSKYVAPLDGRPRVIWKQGELAADFSGTGLSQQCAAALAAAIYQGHLPEGTGRVLDFDPDLRDRLLVHSVSVRPADQRYAPGWVAVEIAVGPRYSGRSSGDSGKAAEALAIVLILILGPIDMYYSFAPPESSTGSAEVIDLINGYNEAVRTNVPGCAWPIVHAPTSQPPDAELKAPGEAR